MSERLSIREVIVVEGTHDRDRVQRAVLADVIVTGGARIGQEVYQQLERVSEERGIIVFTDPDFAGEQIRKQIASRFPRCKHARLPRKLAMRGDDIGVENAEIPDIRRALEGVRSAWDRPRDEFTWDDIVEHGLTATPRAAARRERLGALLRIGYANAKTFCKRLNALQVTRAEFDQALVQLEAEERG